MADFENIIKKHVGEDGNIPSSAIGTVISAIKTAVGNEYVEKDRYKAKLTEIDTLKEQVQTAEDSVTTAEKWKKKYEDEKQNFANYKADQEAKATVETKKKAYNDLLKEIGIADKWLSRVIKGVSFDGIELDEKDKIKDADKLKESIKEEWGDCITTEETKGAQPAKPPAHANGDGKTPSRAAEIAAKYHNDLYGSNKKED